MTILRLLIVSLLVSQIFAGQGAEVICNGTGCSNCPIPPTSNGILSWETGKKDPTKCLISSCPLSYAPINGTTDIYCQSCPGIPFRGVPAIFANSAGDACVPSSETCGIGRTANTWNYLDCYMCNGKDAPLAKSDQSVCLANRIPGDDVSCAGTGCASPENCPTPPTSTPALSWMTGTGSGKCAISSCPPYGTPINGATDLYCQSCPGTPNGNIKAVFANNSGNACVASTRTCGKSRTVNTWTNADCLACNGTNNKYAKSDKSGCQSTAPSSFSFYIYSNSMIILSSILFLITFLF
ncbi:cell surface immobilization antigen (macronuclear) [Tetrahymena thermophila SB210]|uniref:Cell surface immobilization antigen n=1 Tax=Tetrahymena thermophila (strain SB210) TaxID=312017 RepID=Q24JG5_TETTS|nr:cell surface immobilization antigen [Tetrahymena thermophila SB210]EAS07926.2 cell surface immobilization antigen [Tetrahymena thermophila SB210]|eukprot:XP_001028168.2 cell surface immobilization antigen [Tetrahymena thermophila SB210]